MSKQADIDVLKQQDRMTLAGWWCKLNRWKWPRGLPRPEARSLDVGGNPRRDAIMRNIVSAIGRKACLDEWNRPGGRR